MHLETSNYARPNATYLQGVARYVTGTPAGELKVGDTMVFNGGNQEPVSRIDRETKAFVWIATPSEYFDSGECIRRIKKTTIIARPASELGL